MLFIHVTIKKICYETDYNISSYYRHCFPVLYP